jgi:hypothetical protein
MRLSSVGNKGYAIAASVAGAAVVVAVIFLAMNPIIGIPTPPGNVNGTSVTRTATVNATAPEMLLIVLRGSEDASEPVAQYSHDAKEPISLAANTHIRFDSPDRRTPEGIKVLARDMDDGTMHILRKSYDVNNEFFINLAKGDYQLQVQASWFEIGSYVYNFHVVVK